MKIRILNSVGGLDFSFSANSEVDVEKAIADDLIKAGHAEAIKTTKQAKTEE